MPATSSAFRYSRLLLVATCLSWLPLGTPASAQKSIEGRVDRLEKEMQAVQRKVFPGGDGQIVAPDVTPQATPAQPVGSPATTPLTDLTARVNAIESQLARLTGQVEENGHRLRLLEDANAKLSAQLQQMQSQTTPPADTAAEPPVQAIKAPMAKGPPAATAKTAQPASAKPDAAAQARLQAVAAIEKPSTGNAARDGYTYGYRLWTAKFYPEAQAQLQATVDQYPNDPVASRTANLLGRAYLDDGKPTQAAKVLFENYRVRPKGDRAAESLAWVGEALIQLKRMKDACLAYEELSDSFADTMPASVREMMSKGRTRAKCGA